MHCRKKASKEGQRINFGRNPTLFPMQDAGSAFCSPVRAATGLSTRGQQENINRCNDTSCDHDSPPIY